MRSGLNRFLPTAPFINRAVRHLCTIKRRGTGRATRDRPAPGNTFRVWMGGPVRDFELRLQYRVIPNSEGGFANSGIQYRSRLMDRTHFAMAGYQADMDAAPDYSAILYEERVRGVMALRGERVRFNRENGKEILGSVGDPAKIQSNIRTRDWNDYVILARGNRLQHFINGQLTVDVIDESPRAAMQGLLGFQLHAGDPMSVQFREVRLRKLRLEGR
ncbi:MAG: DUF1080 domain-containing protein [Verrucomicrobiota bacterium]|nr:DUF1080 domain-containing protein [Limisphaera sp.]MDW8382379.1 DUF1080 domain-containing protein [Verrucomicrobiota bacterium]